jgi:hypothetical protein
LHRRNWVWIWILATGFGAGQVYSARIQPEGVFLDDSVSVGQQVAYALSVRYPVALNILFPDSTYDFSPFELNRRVYFQTVSDSVLSFDSAVYYLSTFEIDSVQRLQLPVFVVNAVDSTVVYTAPDSVLLRHKIREMPQQPDLRSDTAFRNLKRTFNYPLAGAILGAVAVAVIIVVLLFGKRIVRWWKLKRIKRRHKRFTRDFFNLMRNVSSNNPSTSPEHVLAVWKQYMERLEGTPMSKLTTREITALYPSEALKHKLQAIDRIVYAGSREKDMFSVFDYLLNFAVEKYNERIRALSHG